MLTEDVRVLEDCFLYRAKNRKAVISLFARMK